MAPTIPINPVQRLKLTEVTPIRHEMTAPASVKTCGDVINLLLMKLLAFLFVCSRSCLFLQTDFLKNCSFGHFV